MDADVVHIARCVRRNHYSRIRSSGLANPIGDTAAIYGPPGIYGLRSYRLPQHLQRSSSPEVSPAVERFVSQNGVKLG